MEKLLSYFFDDALEEAEPGEDVAALVDLNLKVAPAAVVRVLKDYVEERERQRQEEGTARSSFLRSLDAQEAAFARRERERKCVAWHGMA